MDRARISAWVAALLSLPLAGCEDDVQTTLTAYETLRVALASERLESVAGYASDLASKAHDGEDQVEEKLRYHMQELAGAARQLGARGAISLATARRDFQEVSRHVVALLEADLEKREGYHLFECATLDGYQRWVQATPDVASPYGEAGDEACGTPAKWAGGDCPFDHF